MSMVLPIALVSTLGALFYVDMQYKADKEKVAENAENAETEVSNTKKHLRLALMGTSVVICIAMIYSVLNKKMAKSSFENRVAHTANALRSSMKFDTPPQDDFSARVSKAAADLRKQIASPQSSANLYSNSTSTSPSNLAAQASAEISQFIADNS